MSDAGDPVGGAQHSRSLAQESSAVADSSSAAPSVEILTFKQVRAAVDRAFETALSRSEYHSRVSRAHVAEEVWAELSPFVDHERSLVAENQRLTGELDAAEQHLKIKEDAIQELGVQIQRLTDALKTQTEEE